MNDWLTLRWPAPRPSVTAYVLGTVESVLYAHPERRTSLPPFSHGLGALSDGTPSETGEGILVRGRAAVAPPAADGPLVVQACPDTARVTTPFFVAWDGGPVAVGRVAPARALQTHSHAVGWCRAEGLKQAVCRVVADGRAQTLTDLDQNVLPRTLALHPDWRG